MSKHNLAKQAGRLCLALLVAFSFGYGYYGLYTYALPLSKDNFRQAMTSKVADESEVLIQGAAKAYDEERYSEVSKVLELALEKLIDKGGRYKAADADKLVRVFFLLGKTFHKQEEFGKAIMNYEETLRLNPQHLPAKYNLEMIQMKGGGGKGGTQKPDKGKIQPQI